MVKKEEYYAINRKTMGIAIVSVVIIAVVLGIYFKGEFEKTPEEEGVPKFELTAIENTDCTECLNVSQAVEVIKGAPTLNITSERIISFDSEEAKKLIEKYELERLPAFILKGKNLDTELPPFEKKKDALVFGKSPPIYYDIEKDKAVGKVNAILIENSECKECFDLFAVLGQLKTMGMAIVAEETLEYDSEEGEALIEEYDITKVPTLIFSEDAAEYDLIAKSWEQIGSIEEDGKLITRTVNPPYYDLVAERVRGLVDVTYLVDNECGPCFNPSYFKNHFQMNLGVVFGSQKTIDISSEEGKEMLEKYNITLIPTLVFSSELKEYALVKQMWAQLGTVVDGNYVFTRVDGLKDVTYKDLSTGELIDTTEKEESAETENAEVEADEKTETDTAAEDAATEEDVRQTEDANVEDDSAETEEDTESTTGKTEIIIE